MGTRRHHFGWLRSELGKLSKDSCLSLIPAALAMAQLSEERRNIEHLLCEELV